jgi:hypothetical protein
MATTVTSMTYVRMRSRRRLMIIVFVLQCVDLRVDVVQRSTSRGGFELDKIMDFLKTYQASSNWFTVHT